jgi:hypothetical protein
MDNQQLILDAMVKAAKPLANGEISELTGLDKKIVEKEMKKLKDLDKIESPKRCYWQPK